MHNQQGKIGPLRQQEGNVVKPGSSVLLGDDVGGLYQRNEFGLTVRREFGRVCVLL